MDSLLLQKIKKGISHFGHHTIVVYGREWVKCDFNLLIKMFMNSKIELFNN